MALVLAGPPELTLVYVCPGTNMKREGQRRCPTEMGVMCNPTQTCAISAGVAYRTALPSNARGSRRPGQDWSSQRGHQLRAEPRPDSGTVAKNRPPLQACAGSSISEKHRTRGTQAPIAAGNVTALVGTRVRGLLAFINVWGTERDQSSHHNHNQ